MKSGQTHLSFDNIRSTAVMSFLFHVVVLIIFLLVQVSTRLDLPEFVEVNFVSGNVSTAQQQRPPARFQPAVQPAAEEEQATIKETIQLPKRRMLEDEPPELSARTGEKRSPIAESSSRITAQPSEQSERGRFTPETGSDKKDIIEPGKLSDKRIPEINQPGKTGLASSFEIEGKAAERKIMSKILPEYPQGYSKEGVIKIRFSILPNGLVGEMIPVLKTDAVLEENAMEALRKWRFNPVPRSAPQETVEGIITFRYKLQ